MSGAGALSPQAIALRNAAEDCAKAATDRKYFVNESEAVLARFEKALRAFTKQSFPDEKEVLESLDHKDHIVQFLMDCVRNRTIAWRIVSDTKTMLTSSSPQWTKAFNRYSGPPVDLERRPGAPKLEPPQPKAPIPFCVELLAVMALIFPLLALLLSCDCYLRFYMFLLGLMMLVPLLIFEFLWFCGCGWLVYRFSIGAYAPKLRRRELGFMWWPSSAIFEGPGGRSDDLEEEENYGWTSFGQWWCHVLRADATVESEEPRFAWSGNMCSCRRCARTADSDSESDDSDTDHRAVAGKAKSVSSSSSTSGEGSQILTQVSLCDSKGLQQTVDLYADGSLVGLSQWVESDGNSIFFGEAGRRSEEYWGKLDCFRLDFCRKAWCCVAALGLLMALIAAAFPPGISGQCGPVKLPLEVYFALDASGSIDAQTWEDEKAATLAIYTEFESTYKPATDQVYVGVGQFSSQAAHVINTSNILAAVTQTLQPMIQKKGGTHFQAALKLCNAQLGAFHPSGGGETFQVAVLITDGQDSDDTPADVLRGLIPGINLMGIYVGSTQAHRERMQRLSCYGSSTDCPWFVDATNFEELKERSAQVAEQVTSQVQTNECNRPLWVLFSLPLLLPFFIWWLYLRINCTPKLADTSWKHQDPQRLHVAGRNETPKLAAATRAIQ